jgi:hypothetical protein
MILDLLTPPVPTNKKRQHVSVPELGGAGGRLFHDTPPEMTLLDDCEALQTSLLLADCEDDDDDDDASALPMPTTSMVLDSSFFIPPLPLVATNGIVHTKTDIDYAIGSSSRNNNNNHKNNPTTKPQRRVDKEQQPPPRRHHHHPLDDGSSETHSTSSSSSSSSSDDSTMSSLTHDPTFLELDDDNEDNVSSTMTAGSLLTLRLLAESDRMKSRIQVVRRRCNNSNNNKTDQYNQEFFKYLHRHHHQWDRSSTTTTTTSSSTIQPASWQQQPQQQQPSNKDSAVTTGTMTTTASSSTIATVESSYQSSSSSSEEEGEHSSSSSFKRDSRTSKSGTLAFSCGSASSSWVGPVQESHARGLPELQAQQEEEDDVSFSKEKDRHSDEKDGVVLEPWRLQPDKQLTAELPPPLSSPTKRPPSSSSSSRKKETKTITPTKQEGSASSSLLLLQEATAESFVQLPQDESTVQENIVLAFPPHNSQWPLQSAPPSVPSASPPALQAATATESSNIPPSPETSLMEFDIIDDDYDNSVQILKIVAVVDTLAPPPPATTTTTTTIPLPDVSRMAPTLFDSPLPRSPPLPKKKAAAEVLTMTPDPYHGKHSTLSLKKKKKKRGFWGTLLRGKG